MDSPDVKDYLVKYQVPVDFFWTAYPDSTVDRIQRAERVLAASSRCWTPLADPFHWGRTLPCSYPGNHERMRPLLRRVASDTSAGPASLSCEAGCAGEPSRGRKLRS